MVGGVRWEPRGPPSSSIACPLTPHLRPPYCLALLPLQMKSLLAFPDGATVAVTLGQELAYTGLMAVRADGSDDGNKLAVIYDPTTDDLFAYPIVNLGYCEGETPGEACNTKPRSERAAQCGGAWPRHCCCRHSPTFRLVACPPLLTGCKPRTEGGRTEEGGSCQNDSECCSGLHCVPRSE